MKSTEFLQAAIDVQAERGKQYDKPSGERSMAATVSAFNCITGSMLEESDGWMFLGLLKLVRQSQNPEQYHHDSALDFVAYASLYAEAASEQCGQVEAREAEKAAHIISDIPDMRNWKNWQAGDTVICVSHSNNWSRKINLGSMACIDSVSEDTSHGLHLEIHGIYMTPDDFEFVSRPTSTAK